MLRHFTVLGVGVVMVVFSAFAAYAELLPPERTTLGKINLAYERGELPYDYAITYKFLGLFGKTAQLVPAEYRGERYGSAEYVSGTPIILEMHKAYPTLRPALKALIKANFVVEETPGEHLDVRISFRRTYWGDSNYGGYTIHKYDTPEGNFKVHYVTEGPNAIKDLTDSDGDGHPDIIEWTGADMELVYHLYSGENLYGFTSKGDFYMLPVPGYEDYMPLRDYYADVDGSPWPGENYDYGGDARWDVYLGKLDANVGGATWIDRSFGLTSWYDYSGYFTLPNSYYPTHLDPYSGNGWNTTSIAAHEFEHCIQFMHDALESSPSAPTQGQMRWYLEASSMYGEHFCFEAQPDFISRAKSFLNNTLRSIENTGDGGYIACIINMFLEDWVEKEWLPPDYADFPSDRIVGEVWRAATGPGDPFYTGEFSTNRDPKAAIGHVLRENNPGTVYVEGSEFKTAFERWTKWNWFTKQRHDGKHYVYGDQLIEVKPRFTFSDPGDYPVVDEPAGSFKIDHLGHVYALFENLPGWTAGVLTFTGADANPEGSEDWAGHVCVYKNGTWQSIDGVAGEFTDMLSPQDIGILQIRNPAQYDSFVFCLANSSYVGLALDYSFSFTETNDTTPPVTTLTPVQTQANPDYVDILVGANEQLFGFPEVFATYTPTGGVPTKVEIPMVNAGNGLAFTGTLVLAVGFSGTGSVEYLAADLAGNIVGGTKNFSAATLAGAGGTVGSEGAYLRAPAGAFTSPTLVTIFEADMPGGNNFGLTAISPAVDNPELIGTPYAYGPAWVNLKAPVSIIISYDGLDVDREDYLSVYQWNGSSWVDLGGTIDKVHKRVTAEANSLGSFILGYGDLKEGGGGFVPSSYALFQSYPNPMVTKAKIKYTLPEDTHVTVKIYNIKGQLVQTLVDEEATAGTYVKEVAADGFANGVYLYRMDAGGYNAVKKMVVAR